ncbi:MAG: hypothetical protein HY842_03170 [Bacteroidetes bacterium]|nr:hypothetical protein [Bacteroidota bacterium]
MKKKAMNQPAVQPLTNLQLELLELYAHHTSEEELLEIKQILGEYYARKAFALADEIWDKNGWNQQTMESWSKEKLRTPYKSQQEFFNKKKNN